MGKRSGARAPQKKKKLEVVFDVQKRKEFLTGFRKRKNERRKKAKEQVETLLKVERKRIHIEAKDRVKQFKKSFEPLKELTEEEKQEKEYEDDEVQVKIVELSANDFATQRNLLGANQQEEDEEESEGNPTDEDDKEEDKPDFIPGMDRTKKKIAKKSANAEEENKLNGEIKSKKDIDRLMKKTTIKNLKKSKIFKQKEKLNQVANRKKSRLDKRNTLKSLPRHMQKVKKRFNNDVNRKIKKGRGKLKRK